MKIILALVVLCLGIAALGNPVQHSGKHHTTVDHAFLEKQYKVLTLFHHVNQPSVLEEHVQIYQTVQDPVQWLQVNKASFLKPEVVDTLINFFHNEYILPKGVPFSTMTKEHLEQAIALFKLFYYAKDFNTFYQAAVVMHQFTNEGLYLYSLSVAVVHRKDTYGIILPPIYEVYPWYFYGSEVIQQAYKHKMEHGAIHKNGNEHDHHVYANYSGYYLNLHWEQSLSYFMEDVGLNSVWYYLHLYYPDWMDGNEFYIKNDYRGEIILTMLQGIVARYYLERLSHGEGQIPNFDWEVPFETPYYPSLQYPNGLTFPERPKFAKLIDSYRNCGTHVNSPYAFSYTHVVDFERRIRDAIDSGVVFDIKQGKVVPIYDPEHHNEAVNAFGNLLQGNADSPNNKAYKNYTSFASHLLGYSFNHLDWKHTAPSALEHHETALRDPAFYQLAKKILTHYVLYQHVHMQPYHKSELVFPGVSIDKVEIDRLITYFDEFYSDISNAVTSTPEELKDDSFKIWAVQKRLNHKPFTYKIHITSNQDVEATVKVFLGPKYDEYGRRINITENRLNFVPIDIFKLHLISGQNFIKRSSQESEYFNHDRTTHNELFDKVMSAYKGQREFSVVGNESYFYFPDRLMLPIGSYNGVPYQFYFIVYPYKPYVGQKEEMTFSYPHPGTGGGYVDDYPIYYPFNKPIKFGKMFVHEVPNSYFYETKIYHRTADEAQVSQPQHIH